MPTAGRTAPSCAEMVVVGAARTEYATVAMRPTTVLLLLA